MYDPGPRSIRARARQRPRRMIRRCYGRHGVVYAIEVVFPDPGDSSPGCRDAWSLDFRKQPPQLSRDLDPRANVVHRIAASALTGWIRRQLGWFTVRAYSRRYATLCRVSRCASKVQVETIDLPDLLMHFLIYEAAGSEDAARRRIDWEISRLRGIGLGTARARTARSAGGPRSRDR